MGSFALVTDYRAVKTTVVVAVSVAGVVSWVRHGVRCLSFTLILWHCQKVGARVCYIYLHKKEGQGPPKSFALTAITLLALALEGTTLAHTVALGGALVAITELVTVAVCRLVRRVHCHWSYCVSGVILL